MPWERDWWECPGNKTGGNGMGMRLAGMAWERDWWEWPGNRTKADSVPGEAMSNCYSLVPRPHLY